MSSVIIVGPPSWALDEPNRPLAGVAAIASYLKSQGVERLEVLDLNYAFLVDCRRRVADRLGKSRLVVEHEEIAGWAREYERSISRIYALRRGPTRSDSAFGLSQLVEHNKSKLGDFLASDDNVFARALPRIFDFSRFATGRNVFGVSVNAPSQLIATLTFARALKKVNPENVVVVGGPFVTLCINAFLTPDPLLVAIDHAIPSAGEEPFTELLEDLRSDDHTRRRSGVVYRCGDHIEYEPRPVNPALVRTLPAPDYGVFDSPNRFDALPYEASRGCAWSRCKFCYHSGYYGARYQPKPIDHVIEDLQTMFTTMPARTIIFADAELPPKRFRALSTAILSAGLEFKWWCMARIQHGWDRTLFELGRQAGCIQIDWGMEHINERLTRFIGKPVDRKQTLSILRDCNAAGIQVLVQTITGLPTETPDERDELFAFLESQNNLFTSTPHLYLLAPESEFFRNREVYGIEADATEEDTFATGYRYSNRVPSADAIMQRILGHDRQPTGAQPNPGARVMGDS